MVAPQGISTQTAANSRSVICKPAKPAATPTRNTKLELYTPQRALELFKTYADEDGQDVIGPEGFERLCSDAEMPMEGARPLIFAWQMQATEMGKVSKQEWTRGMATLKCVYLFRHGSQILFLP